MALQHINSKVKLLPPKADPLYPKFLAHWGWTVILAPILWVLGLNLLIYHIMSLVLFLNLVRYVTQHNRILYVPRSTLLLLLIMVTYATSIFIHSGQGEGSRVIAALYNLGYWVMGCMLIVFFSNLYIDELIEGYLLVFYRLAQMSALLALFALVCQSMGIQTVVFETPLSFCSHFLGDTVLVTQSLVVKILQLDWFISLWRPRFNLYSPYPTATGGLFVLLLFAVWAHATQKKMTRDVRFLAVMGLLIVGLVMTLSRLSLLAFVIAGGVVFIVEKRTSLLWIFVVGLCLIVSVPALEKLMQIFLGLREGSNESRFDLYRHSLDQLEGADWILGVGLKPRETAFTYPLGSHSTYLSILFRMGAVGLLLFISFQAMILWRWLQMKPLVIKKRSWLILWRFFGCVFIGMLIWMVTEDLDAPQLLAFLYFSCIGFFEGFRRYCL